MLCQWILFLIFFRFSWSLVLPENITMEACEPKNCGNLSISYPFWINGEQPDYCGYPTLKIDCVDGKPLLARSYNMYYYIDTIFYENNSAVLINSVLANSTAYCPIHKFNVTLSLSQFVISPSPLNKELIFFYNCSKSLNPPSNYSPITTCTNQSYLSNETFVRLYSNYPKEMQGLPDDLPSDCSISRVPVLGRNNQTAEDYLRLMKEGLLVSWMVANCSLCKESNGQCGFSSPVFDFICICSNVFFIPCLSSSCMQTLPCNKSIEIHPPFFLSDQTNASCKSKTKIGCENNIPTIYPFNHRYAYNTHGYYLESISYENKTLIFQDPDMARSLRNSNCDRFMVTLFPFKFNYTIYLYFNNTFSSFECGLSNQTTFPHTGFQYEKLTPGCSKPKNTTFEWTLSFNNTNRDLFVRSARFFNDPSSLSECSALDIGTRSHSNKILIGSTTAGALVFIVACIIFVIKFQLLRIFFWKHSTQESIEKTLEKYGSLAPKKYKYSELKKITNSFRDKLGKGGFGTVYKGTQQDGRLVAVKFLHNSTSNGEEFINEVISISRTSHVNVVNLLGFCIEGSIQALVYEYMPNGSLDKYIYSEIPETNLCWEKLYEIAIGIARGLDYLHSDCSTRIVHFDIKPQNILLDKDFRPKIADFGLAKLCPPKESILSFADMRGTIGFIAPEVFSRSVGVVSTKSDVYSFGMLILEIVGGRKNFKMSVQNSSQAYFPHWIYDHITQNGEIQICDVTNETEEITRKMALVGLWCIQIAPPNRPSMGKVMKMFESSLDELEMPPKPYFNSPPRLQEIFSSYSNF
ncbi:hypothetical protein LUZ60_009924 [Juncus effusus]|nr:hypothetical protein LUZ60_009924 [Juncus effusus]